eukprot:6214497-Pleurochrysis_carterae.AAC.2
MPWVARNTKWAFSVSKGIIHRPMQARCLRLNWSNGGRHHKSEMSRTRAGEASGVSGVNTVLCVLRASVEAAGVHSAAVDATQLRPSCRRTAPASPSFRQRSRAEATHDMNRARRRGVHSCCARAGTSRQNSWTNPGATSWPGAARRRQHNRELAVAQPREPRH